MVVSFEIAEIHPFCLLTGLASKEAMKKSATVGALFVALILLLSVLIIVSLNNHKPSESTTQQYTYSIVNTFPHDQNAFTEGLFYDDGFLYESTGLNGASTLRQVKLTSGEVIQEIALPSQFFGEGITLVNDSIVQLTWQSHLGFVYNKESFALLENFSYTTQGWGLTFDGKYLIMSDGSSYLLFLDPGTFQQVAQIQVHDGNASVSNLNELEYVNGDVYANIFLQQKIAVISPETGQVKAWIDLTGLQGAPSSDGEKVLNGIAYDSKDNRLFVTGKDWLNLYEIKLVSTK
jgi:glutaminyl-peptide cyclotransferase